MRLRELWNGTAPRHTWCHPGEDTCKKNKSTQDHRSLHHFEIEDLWKHQQFHWSGCAAKLSNQRWRALFRQETNKTMVFMDGSLFVEVGELCGRATINAGRVVRNHSSLKGTLKATWVFLKDIWMTVRPWETKPSLLMSQRLIWPQFLSRWMWMKHWASIH